MEEILVSLMMCEHRLTLLRTLAWPFMKLAAALSWKDLKWEHFLLKRSGLMQVQTVSTHPQNMCRERTQKTVHFLVEL